MPNPPPTGTVTFLFTDIEGSTKLAQTHPAEWPALQARHHAILQQAIDGEHGHVFQIVGDAFCAAFHHASDALAAALAAQRALKSSNTQHASPMIRVRMGLHTGDAEFQTGGYHGYLTLSRVQRVMSLAHGGQILLSQSTSDLARDRLPDGATLRDLGAIALKDFPRAEHVCQLVAPDLPSEFPPLRTLGTIPNNLPRQLTSFIGRTAEVSQLRQMLAATSLLTLTGAGGVGKTRLALQVAAELMDDFADGVFFVALADLTDPYWVLRTIAQSFELREEHGALQTQLKDYLREKRLLLVLDNCEQVFEVAGTVSELLSAAPRLKVLVTSRALLRIYGEVGHSVLPLALPNPKQLPAVDRLEKYEAIALFMERARAVKNDFSLNTDNASAVAEICYQLDGLPLAIELAAARVRLLTPQRMLPQLSNRLKFLTGGARDMPARQQTLRGALDWSYQLLSAAEQALFRRLAVFVGGCTLEAVEAVSSAADALDLLGTLESLVDKSLLKSTAVEGESRFGMLETIREYGRERLDASGEREPVELLHCEWCLKLAATAETELLGDHQVEWLKRLEQEHDNLRSALSRSVERGDGDSVMRLAVPLYLFWEVRGYHSEGLRWLRQALAVCKEQVASQPTTEFLARYAQAQVCAGHLAISLGDYALARKLSEESLTSFRQIGDKLGEVQSLNTLGRLACNEGDFPLAQTWCEESLVLGRALGDKYQLSFTLILLGNVASNQSDYAKARTLYEESLALCRESGTKFLMAFTNNYLGGLAANQGDHATARTYWDEGLALTSELRDKRGIASSLHNLGTIAELQGDQTAARALFEDSLALRRELGDKPGIARSLRNLGKVALNQADYVAARILYAESLALVRELGSKRDIAASLAGFSALSALSPLRLDAIRAVRLAGAAQSLLDRIGAASDREDSITYERGVAAARAQISEAAFNAAWAEGRALGVEQAIALALEEPHA